MTYQRFEKCIEICSACARECRALAAVMPGAKLARLARACRDAALLCELFVDDLCSESPCIVYSSRMCASACDDCARACDQHKTEAGKQCAALCRRCSKECRNVRVWLGEMQLVQSLRWSTDTLAPPLAAGWPSPITMRLPWVTGRSTGRTQTTPPETTSAVKSISVRPAKE